MKFLILFISIFLLASCSSEKIEPTTDAEMGYYGKSNDTPKFKWLSYYPPSWETFYTTYNSWKILEVYALMEISPIPHEYLNIETMEMEKEYPYVQNSACTFSFCGRYKILVEYTIDSVPYSFKKYEYVVDQSYVDWPNELIDDSDYYKNK